MKNSIVSSLFISIMAVSACLATCPPTARAEPANDIAALIQQVRAKLGLQKVAKFYCISLTTQQCVTGLHNLLAVSQTYPELKLAELAVDQSDYGEVTLGGSLNIKWSTSPAQIQAQLGRAAQFDYTEIPKLEAQVLKEQGLVVNCGGEGGGGGLTPDECLAGLHSLLAMTPLPVEISHWLQYVHFAKRFSDFEVFAGPGPILNISAMDSSTATRDHILKFWDNYQEFNHLNHLPAFGTVSCDSYVPGAEVSGLCLQAIRNLSQVVVPAGLKIQSTDIDATFRVTAGVNGLIETFAFPYNATVSDIETYLVGL